MSSTFQNGITYKFTSCFSIGKKEYMIDIPWFKSNIVADIFLNLPKKIPTLKLTPGFKNSYIIYCLFSIIYYNCALQLFILYFF